MRDRQTIEQLVNDLHAARLDSDLERLCGLFADDAQLRIVGTSDGKPITIDAVGVEQIRRWLGMMVKAFRLSDYERLATIVDGERAAVHWRVQIRSKITGAVVPTELFDLIEAREARILRHTEFFISR